MRTETLWILVAIGIALFVGAMFFAARRNKGQSASEVRRSEQGAHDLRDRLDRGDT